MSGAALPTAGMVEADVPEEDDEPQEEKSATVTARARSVRMAGVWNGSPCSARRLLCMRRAAAFLTILTLAAPATGQRRTEGRVDPALAVAGEIDRRVATFRAFRSEAVHGEWRDASPWSIRPEAGCLEAARSLPVVPFTTARTPIPAPVRVDGPVGGVAFPKAREGAPLYVACELAVRLPALAAVMRDHHVREATVLSAWRLAPRTSFHTFGLALDLTRFARDDGSVLVVERDWDPEPATSTCDGVDRAPRAEAGPALRALACDLADRAGLSTVITPEYNEGHHDHFHVDVRPHDARTFVR